MNGNGTTLVSLYIPAKAKDLSKVTQKIKQEISTSQNVKDKHTRTAIRSALVSIQYQLKAYSKVPKNGLAIFTGTVSGTARIGPDGSYYV